MPRLGHSNANGSQDIRLPIPTRRIGPARCCFSLANFTEGLNISERIRNVIPNICRSRGNVHSFSKHSKWYAKMGDDEKLKVLTKKFKTDNLNEIAEKNPEKLIGIIGDWVKIKSLYKNDKLSHPGGMQNLLDYRRKLTDDMLNSIKKEVKDMVIDLKKEKLKEYLKQNPERKKEMTAAKKDEFLSTVEMEWKSEGSINPTSDIDVNLKGDGTEIAIGLFNKRFEKKFGCSSGYCVDVNVYAEDFLKKPGKADLVVKNREDKGKFLEQGRLVEPPDFIGDERFKTQELRQYISVAFYKERLYMEKEDWENLKGNIVRENPEMEEILVKAENLFDDYKKNIQDRIGEIRKKNPGIRKEKDLEIAASNIIYEDKMKDVLNCRIELKLLKTFEPDQKEKIDRKLLELNKKISEALIYAQEAYLTPGAINHTVVNKQMLSNLSGGVTRRISRVTPSSSVHSAQSASGYLETPSFMMDGSPTDTLLPATDLDDKKHKVNIKFEKNQYYQSFLEQVGDVYKVMEHTKGDINKSSIESAKYIHRMVNSLKHFDQSVLTELGVDEEKRQIARLLEELKVDGLVFKSGVSNAELAVYFVAGLLGKIEGITVADCSETLRKAVAGERVELPKFEIGKEDIEDFLKKSVSIATKNYCRKFGDEIRQ